MIAEGKGQVARPPIDHRRGHPQRRSLDREAHVQPEVEGIYGPRLRIRLQPEGRGLVAAFDHVKDPAPRKAMLRHGIRSEEHTSELQSLMRNSYAVFCLK